MRNYTAIIDVNSPAPLSTQKTQTRDIHAQRLATNPLRVRIQVSLRVCAPHPQEVQDQDSPPMPSFTGQPRPGTKPAKRAKLAPTAKSSQADAEKKSWRTQPHTHTTPRSCESSLRREMGYRVIVGDISVIHGKKSREMGMELLVFVFCYVVRLPRRMFVLFDFST